MMDERYGLTNQIRRSSRSMCANLAKGFGKQRSSKAEFRRFVSMAQGSAHEVLVWIDYVAEFQYVDDQTFAAWRGEMDTIIKMLHGLYTKI